MQPPSTFSIIINETSYCIFVGSYMVGVMIGSNPQSKSSTHFFRYFNNSSASIIINLVVPPRLELEVFGIKIQRVANYTTGQNCYDMVRSQPSDWRETTQLLNWETFYKGNNKYWISKDFFAHVFNTWVFHAHVIWLSPQDSNLQTIMASDSKSEVFSQFHQRRICAIRTEFRLLLHKIYCCHRGIWTPNLLIQSQMR